jgi:hypothetical protein
MARHPLVLGLADGRADEDATQRPDIKPAGPLVPAEASDAVNEVLAGLRTLGLADQRCLEAHSALSARLKALVASTDRCERLGALLAVHIAVGQLRGADVPLRDDLAGLAGMLPQQADAVAGMRTGAFAAHRLIWQTLDELHALRSS